MNWVLRVIHDSLLCRLFRFMGNLTVRLIIFCTYNRVDKTTRFSELLAPACIAATALLLKACAERDYTPWWMWVLSLSVWPVLDILANLIEQFPDTK